MKNSSASFCGLLILGVGISQLLGGERRWHEAGGFRWADLEVPRSGKTGFTLLSPEQTGINFTNTLDERAGEANRVLFNGSGVAVGDFDNDGWPDLYFCSLNGRNALFKNLGDMKFKDVTQESGIVCTNRFCRGAVFADVNGDGSLDLLVATTGNGVFCFLNDGHGRFSDATRAAGTESKYGSVTLALADIDGNGTLDLYVADNRTEDIRDRGQIDIQMVKGKLTIPPWFKDRLLVVNGKVLEYGEPDILYLNDGQGHFTPASWTDGTFLDEAGRRLSGPPLDWGLTVTFRDLNGDGYPDLYVCNDYWTPDRIWINDGKGHFRALDKVALRNTSASSMGVDVADIARTGSMDVFVVDMLSRDWRLRKRQMFAQTARELPIGAIDNRPQIMRNTLFHDCGDGTYAEVANYSGVTASDWSWSPVFLDVDLDGFEDLLITAGHVRDVQDLDADQQIKARQRPGNAMADPKVRREAFVQEKLENSRFYPRLDMPIVAFHNEGNLRFEETTRLWGTDDPGVHHAIALGDFDNDGDLDLVVNNLGKAAGIYRNETAAPRVAVRLKGLPPNAQGIGAKIKLLKGAVPVQSQEVICGGRYMAGAEPLLVFAAGKAQGGMTIEVRWRGGKQSVVNGVEANRVYEIEEAGAEAAGKQRTSNIEPPTSNEQPPTTLKQVGAGAAISKLQAPSSKGTANSRVPTPNSETKPMFEDLSRLIGHVHHEESFDDFDRQPLLPRKLSQLGPGVAWGDVDGDGWDDLVIGSGKGGSLSVYRNDHRGGFQPTTGTAWNAVVTRDQTTVLVWPKDEQHAVLLAGSANYEDGLAVGSSVRQYDPGRDAVTDVLPAQESSVGPLALADMNGDGNWELFVGGRVIPGRYPEAASSRIYRYEGNLFQLDGENTRLLEKAGLVSGAVWSDLDGDGFAELILACEWGPIRVFKNQSGSLREVTAESGLEKFTGWWNGVTTGDIDGDGRLDIIAGNWGLNSPYRASPEQPARLFYGDFSDRRMVDLIEAEYDPIEKTVVPRRLRDAVSAALPDIASRFPTHKAYSEASIAEVLGDRQSRAREARANTLSSMVFLNRGNRFDAAPLPREAQLSPAFSVNVADFDGDGHEDVFLSQNFFANQPETPRADAGRGLLLLGDGTGNLRAIPGQESGIKVYGEQRGAAVADFDGDGRADLVVTQNGAATSLYRNVAGRPGLRVRLFGPPGNPAGFGAVIRLKFGPRFGPAREIHAGSGYWSQDSAVQVLGAPEAPTEVWVRWPGGRVTTTRVPPTTREVTIDHPGRVRRQ